MNLFHTENVVEQLVVRTQNKKNAMDIGLEMYTIVNRLCQL